jgi:succinyl-diaminopimelate desuccinylase
MTHSQYEVPTGQISFMQPELDLQELKRHVFHEIDRLFPSEIELLQQLIRIPSVNPPGKYEEIAAFLRSYAHGLGVKFELYETPKELCKAAGIDSDDRRLSVKTTAPNRRVGPKILLLGHLDTVPPGDASQWKHDPFGGEVADEKVYGRGSCDCKGRVAAYLSAQLALATVYGELPFELSVAATADEEIGGRTGAAYLLQNGNLNCDYCIGEGYTWEVFHGFKGLLWSRISIEGKSAHGATPHLGVSAIQPLEDLLKELREYQSLLNSRNETAETTLNIGVVRAGEKINMVPASATVEIDMRVGEGYGLQQAADDISGIANRVAESHKGLKIRVDLLNRTEPIALPASHILAKTVQSSVEEVAKTSVPLKLWFAHSDTVHFLRKGIPSVNYGVGRAGVAHTADEHVILEDLKLSTKAVALAVMKLGTVQSN